MAAKLEGMQWTDLNGDAETMRAEDHQLIQPLYSAVLSKDVKYDVEGTGLGWKTVGKVTAGCDANRLPDETAGRLAEQATTGFNRDFI